MTRRMFALVGPEGEHVEYASPAEGKDGELYLARLVADPAHIEVDPETREPLKPPARAKGPGKTTTEKADAPRA